MDKKELVKLISFMVMGDGGLYFGAKSKNARFVMNMKEENKDYIDFVSEVLSNITSTTVKTRTLDNSDGVNRKPQLRVETAAHPFFTILHDRIYTADGHKGIDMHTLKLLDWQAMAILYMCDGSLHTYLRPEIGMKNPSHTLTLNLKRLSEAEQLVLKQAIRDLLGVEFNVQRQGKYHYLRLRSRDVPKFMEGVSPYMCDSFKYKTIRTKAPETGEDIVCSVGQLTEAGRNDQP
jgi:hypothetical protein